MLTQAQLADRMALIREVGARFKQNQVRQAQTKRRNAEIVESSSNDERLWTDASKYANEYYGETYRGTVRFDNDWD